MPLPMLVAMAAPSTPNPSIFPIPKIKKGSRIMFNPLAKVSERIAIAALPAPLKIALIRKSIMMEILPPNIHRV